MSADAGRNRLADETSPYLLQHKDNPVHWWPWCDEAFAAARDENKPILLSVGYAACHWCHVMAHESFENSDIADAMNTLFINIKVDREERPDVDAIYQKALAATGEQGGWPLTMFITPEGKPFFGGTYFPPDARWGRPGFPQVLDRIAEVYASDKSTVDQQANKLTAHLSAPADGDMPDALSLDMLNNAANHVVDYFDTDHGGLEGAPKFPMAETFEFVWRAYRRTGDTRYRDLVTLTLDRICQGGIYDHLGGGFARYSTDERWLAPHFEKMLYDNAQLISLMTLVWQETKSDLYSTRIEETIAWLTREMIGENGAFAATLDADSEGEEGKFYVWSETEIDTVLGGDAALFKDVYDVSANGNWEGKTILNRIESWARVLTEDEDKQLAEARAKLFSVREPRIRPGRDDKVLADWNGLMIQALARAGLVFGKPEWTELGRKAFDSCIAAMTWTDGNGRERLGHSLCGGRLQKVDMLDDYANMMAAGLALSEATGNTAYLSYARNWADLVQELFWNDNAHGYYFTASDAENLIVRTSSVSDSATPSGNGVMLGNLARLYHLASDDRYRVRAEALVESFAIEALRSFPHSCAYLNGFELLVDALQVIIVGDRADPDVGALISVTLEHSHPNLMFATVDDREALPPTHTAYGKVSVGGKAAAYVCRGPVCQAPVTTPDDLRSALAA